MTPNLTNLRPRILREIQTVSGVPALPYQDWLDTATCVTCHAFQHRETELFICSLCASRQEHFNRADYRFVVRHYVYIGEGRQFENCAECNNPPIRTRPIDLCDNCKVALRSFVTYLIETGDDPYNDPGTAVLYIIQYSSDD